MSDLLNNIFTYIAARRLRSLFFMFMGNTTLQVSLPKDNKVIIAPR